MRTLRSWSQDRLLRGIVKNSGYLFSSTSVAMLISMVQGVLAARLLGDLRFGIVAATIIPLTSNVHRFLSFRMSELVVKYVGQFLASGEKQRAAAVVKAAAVLEALTSLIAYGVLLLGAPVVARYLAGESQGSGALQPEQIASLITFYGLVLITNSVYETALGSLQITRLFNRQALIKLFESFITISIIGWAYLAGGGMREVLAAYLLGKSFTAAGFTVAAFRALNRALGTGWWRAPLSLLPPWGELARFAFSTNLQVTVNLVSRDNATLFITFLRGPVEAGYYRIALAVINFVLLPIEPFIATTYAEISHTLARREWSLTRRLLKRVSLISAVWTLSAGGFLVLFGWWLIPLVYKPEFAPAYPALVILLVGYGFANIFHWNRPLLLALGMPGYALRASAAAGAVKTVFTLLFVGVWGYLAEALLQSAYFLASIGLILWRGLGELKRQDAYARQAAALESQP